MILTNSSGESIELRVVGYEHPDEELGPTEDNPADDSYPRRWLMVTVKVRTRDGSWQATDPCLDTDELVHLANWLEPLDRGEPPHPNGPTVIMGPHGWKLPMGRVPTHYAIGFTEPNLEWTLDQKLTVLRLRLHWELLPRKNRAQGGVPIDFPLTEIDLHAAVQSLRQQALKFPGQPWPGNHR